MSSWSPDAEVTPPHDIFGHPYPPESLAGLARRASKVANEVQASSLRTERIVLVLVGVVIGLVVGAVLP